MALAGKNHYHFVLIHGACHGAWCWYKVVTSLRSDGHRVTALDMAASGVNPKRLEDLSSLSDYCQPLLDFMTALPLDDKVVLVGHSLGGFSISLAMERFPEKIGLAVFVTAFMPGPDLPASVVNAELFKQLNSFMDSKYSFADGEDNPRLTSLLLGPEFMASQLYQLSPPEDLTLARLLVRPVGFLDEVNELVLSKEKYGSVRRAYVGCERDNVTKQSYQEWLVQNNPADEVKMIAGADHMVMLSKSLELCDCLKDLANKFC